ncbi:hypothetical protein AGMMS49938_00690 [Fibrobacterales bacterium]|nr:hypothetical protein AGMMS49938_00690 [Fibrobacterales bacterium]
MTGMRSSTLEKILFILFDGTAQMACFWLFFPNFREYVTLAVLAWFVIFLCAGLYRKWLFESRTTHILYLAAVFGIVFCFLGAIIFGRELPPPPFSIQKFLKLIELLASYLFFTWISVSFLRLSISFILRQFIKKGYGADNVILLGNTHEARELLHIFKEHTELGKKIIWDTQENYSNLPSIIKKNNAQAIIIAHRTPTEKKINDILYWVAHLPIKVYVVPSLHECVKNFKTTTVSLVNTTELQELFIQNLLPWQATIKRVMDIVIAISLLLITSPLLLLTAIAIKIDSRGSVFYKQQRIGLYSRPFTVYKFRSMRLDAEKNGPQWAKKNDARVTRVGKIIRRCRIDEIPQLLCVLKGDMSMVGPRPERAVFIEKLRREIPFYASRLKMKPGLTGWAQVRHHYDNNIEDVKIKLGYDIYYLSNFSILLDIQILIRTIYVVLSGKGAQ